MLDKWQDHVAGSLLLTVCNVGANIMSGVGFSLSAKAAITMETVQIEYISNQNIFQKKKKRSFVEFHVSHGKCSFYHYLFVLLNNKICGIKALAKVFPVH